MFYLRNAWYEFTQCLSMLRNRLLKICYHTLTNSFAPCSGVGWEGISLNKARRESCSGQHEKRVRAQY